MIGVLDGSLPVGRRSRWWKAPLIAFALALHLTSGSMAEEPARITVFAAASLTDALNDLAKEWREAGNGEIVLSFAASSKLAKQIEQGAPADIFASADMDWMNYLVERKQIEPGTIWAEVGNDLVWIAPPDAPGGTDADPLARLGAGRLALADPESVPAGRYARQALTTLGLWEKVAERLAPTENVRAALVLVERGEAPLGIVYSTDVRKSPVQIVGAIPSDSHDPIIYPMAIVAGHDKPQVRAFFEFLSGPDGADMFRKYGFRMQAPSS